MNSKDTILKIKEDINNLKQTTEDFKDLSNEELNWKPNATQWSILECLEHLNRYSKYYHAELKRSLGLVKKHPTEKIKLSWFGKKSIETVSAENIKPQKTIKKMNPVNSGLDKSVIANYLNFKEDLLNILNEAISKNMNQKKIRVEFFKLIKLSIADTILFLIEHDKRHMKQALKAKENASTAIVKVHS